MEGSQNAIGRGRKAPNHIGEWLNNGYMCAFRFIEIDVFSAPWNGQVGISNAITTWCCTTTLACCDSRHARVHETAMHLNYLCVTELRRGLLGGMFLSDLPTRACATSATTMWSVRQCIYKLARYRLWFEGLFWGRRGTRNHPSKSHPGCWKFVWNLTSIKHGPHSG